jgi:integrase
MFAIAGRRRCGLRRAELASLRAEDIQIRQGHRAIVDLVGKGNHVRTVPMPIWVQKYRRQVAQSRADKYRTNLQDCQSSRNSLGKRHLRERRLVRGSNCAQRLEFEHLAPHDLRRTCAKLCHVNGGELEQIQFLLGHASVLTTERYLGCKQNLEKPVNDRFGCLFRTLWIRAKA